MRLVDLAWTDVPADALVLVPVGSLEQHGPHLPLDTDTVVAEAVAVRAVELLAGSCDPVLVAPAVTYAASGEHQSFAGTTSTGTEALRHVLVELTRSLTTWARRVVLVNGHGGNLEALRSAVPQLRDEGHDVAWVACAAPGSDAHAGAAETSLMLHLQPGRVRIERARAGNSVPLAELLRDLVTRGVRAVAPDGVLGDPTGATAGEGARLFEAMALDVARALRQGRPDPGGRLLDAPVSR